jgi:hypothetical protein
MTTIDKAIAFARECLKWPDADLHSSEAFILGPTPEHRLYFGVVESVEIHLTAFLGKRFSVQINRGTSTLFQWSVWVALQNRMSGPSVYDHGRGEGDNILDAIFDACVAAQRLYPDV